jgi:hypothetical protein
LEFLDSQASYCAALNHTNPADFEPAKVFHDKLPLIARFGRIRLLTKQFAARPWLLLSFGGSAWRRPTIQKPLNLL